MKLKQKTLVSLSMIIIVASTLTVLLGVSSVSRAKSCNGVETSIISCDKGDIGSCSDGSTPINGTCVNEGLCTDGTKPVNGKCISTKGTITKAKIIKYIPPNSITDTGLWSLLLVGINILTAGVGVAAVTGVIWGGFMYLTASDSAEQARKAKMILWNTTIGIVVYALMYSFLNFLIPGGLFN